MNSPLDSPGEASGDLLARAREGDEEAWRQLFETCYPKVLRVVRRKLDRPMRSLYDSTDFASDVMKSLAAKFKKFDFPNIDSLQAYLAQVAKQKVIDEYRRLHTLKHDINREQSFYWGAESGLQPIPLASSDPTASQEAQATEAHEQILARLDETERRVVGLKRQGMSNAEVAEKTGWHVRKVQRFLQELGESLGLTEG